MAIKIQSYGDKIPVKIEFVVTSSEAKTAVVRMLKLMRTLGGWGASREIGVLDDSDMKNMNVYFDGDGWDKLEDVTVDGKELDEVVGDWPKKQE
jgi:hypothetical protein